MSRRIKLLSLLLLLGACRADPVPRPRGYFRIDLPEPTFTAWADSAVMSLEAPAMAHITSRGERGAARWYDIRYPALRGTVHLTWSPVGDDLPQLIEDAHAFKNTHQSKAGGIRSTRMIRPEDRVFGTLFKVEGDVASPFVFYLTDSTDNFLYGALYFDAPPNADSLAPVTERVRADMQHLAATLKWR
jgi:gliding motility-associated lipoprotein GldD